MWTVVICGVLGAVITPRTMFWGFDAKKVSIGASIGAVVGVFFGVILAMILGLVINQTSYVEVSRSPLVALSNETSVEGRFFLAGGTIGSDMHYMYYYETGDGGISYGEVSASTVTVYEENRNDAVIVRFVRIGETTPFTFDASSGGGPRLSRYEVYVPEGTVLRSVWLELPGK